MATITIRSATVISKVEFGDYSTDSFSLIGGEYRGSLQVPVGTTGSFRATVTANSSSITTVRFYPNSGTVATLSFSRQTVGTAYYIITEETTVTDEAMTLHYTTSSKGVDDDGENKLD